MPRPLSQGAPEGGEGEADGENWQVILLPVLLGISESPRRKTNK